jgi:pimeloyl-ACP methyl ester carboxylesterase
VTATLVPGGVTGTVDVGGTSVLFEDSVGVGDSRVPVVLIHGTGGSPATHFGYIYPMLASRGRVIAITLADPAGRGTRDLQVSDFVAQVAAVMRHTLAGKPSALVGYSLGAVVAAVVASEHPDLVESLALVSGWAHTDTQQLLRNDVWRALRESGTQRIKEYTVFCAFGGPFLATKSREEIQPAIDAVVISPFTEAQMDLNRSIDIRESLAGVRAPTLVVGGTHDQMVPVRHQKYLFGAIDDCRYTEISSGHAVVFERPAELVSLIETFSAAPRSHAPGTHLPALKP